MAFGLTTRIVEDVLEKLNMYGGFSKWWDAMPEEEVEEIVRELEDTVDPHIEDELRWMGDEDSEDQEDEY